MKYLIYFLFLTIPLLFVNNHLSATPPSHQQPPTPVVVSKVVEMQFKVPVVFIGTVEPDQRSLVASEISGLVKELLFKEGDFVKEGDIIARLKQESLQIELNEANAAFKEGLARLEYATSQSIRFKDLFERAVIPIEELQEVESNRDAWAEKTLQFKSKIDKFQYDINHTEIKAPFNGYVIVKNTEIGEWLVKGASVYEIINLDSIYALVHVPERIAVDLKQGDAVTITFDAFPGLTANGNIQTVIPQASQNARTFPVKVSFENIDNKIKSGLLTRVSFPTGNESISKFVPKDAIVEMRGKKYVYVVNNGIAGPIEVRTGKAHEDMFEVFGEVSNNMDVIIRGNERIRPGQAVKIIPK